jgi:hypothetical protein
MNQFLAVYGADSCQPAWDADDGYSFACFSGDPPVDDDDYTGDYVGARGEKASCTVSTPSDCDLVVVIFNDVYQYAWESYECYTIEGIAVFEMWELLDRAFSDDDCTTTTTSTTTEVERCASGGLVSERTTSTTSSTGYDIEVIHGTWTNTSGGGTCSGTVDVIITSNEQTGDFDMFAKASMGCVVPSNSALPLKSALPSNSALPAKSGKWKAGLIAGVVVAVVVVIAVIVAVVLVVIRRGGEAPKADPPLTYM